MRRQLAGDAEIAGRLHHAGAKQLAPKPIDRDAGRERLFGQQQPFREPQPVARQIAGKRWQHLGRFRGNLVAPLIVLTAIQNESDRRLVFFLHHVGDRAAGLDVVLLARLRRHSRPKVF